ncbi:MAG: M23 family metallopeptidase [Bacteroidetes bacterium]|jgi:murein DD-endopeptidase MepM/ murein hydrolase activator NlpD|nr:M23 family metallopeptidase [Bacteroidota bacterium]MDA0938647.1 M23 family metallopeptidase [Bacteroidota bacterium]MDA1345556.1 M23 family metallopeptidase [Bacteroidota bacterium]
MAKIKYYYDPETLSYRAIETSKVRQFSNLLLFFFTALIFGISGLFLLLNTSWLNTPTELAQERELDNYKLQFDILNRRLGQLEEALGNVEERDNNLYRVYFEASPIPEAQRRVGFGGVNRYQDLEGFSNSDLIINTTKKIDILTKQAVVQSRSLDEIEKLARNKSELLSAIPSIPPVLWEDMKRMASGYGYRKDPFTKKRRMHWGMDFTAPTGTPIYASGDGVVKRVDNRATGYGNHIRIDHGFGYVSLYAHLSKYNVKRGQKVKRGDVIGYVGSTGRSVGPHLHYEIFKDGVRINPLNFYYGKLSPEEFEKLRYTAIQENQSLD